MYDEEEIIYLILFRESTCIYVLVCIIRLRIHYVIGLVSHYTESPTNTYLKIFKRIVHSIKVTNNFDLLPHLTISSLQDIVTMIERETSMIEYHWVCVFHGRHCFHLDVKETIDCYSFYLWSICSCNIMCLSSNLTLKLVKGIKLIISRENKDSSILITSQQ